MKDMTRSRFVAMRVSALLCFAVACVAALLLFVPSAPRMPGSSLDDSWVLALNQALPWHLVYGRDIIFTFGPFAPIFTRTFHPATWSFVLAWTTVLAVCYLVLLFHVSRRHPIVVPLLFAAVATLINDDWNASFMAFPLLASSALYTVISRRLTTRLTASHTSVVLAVGLGSAILLLTKSSFIPACLLTIVVWAVIAAMNRHPIIALGLPVLSLVAVILLWLCAAQPLEGLSDYFRTALPIISGYTEAMSSDGKSSEVITYILVAISLSVMLVPLSLARAQWPRWAFLATVSCTLLMAFKAGFVRHDGHALTAAYVLFIAALISAPWLLRGRAIPMAAVALAVCLYITSGHARITPADLGRRAASWWISGAKQLAALPGSREHLTLSFTEKMTEIRDHAPIPAGTGATADIYSYNQTYLIAQDWRWRPRPVFQSYSVYTPKLNEINRDFLLSDRAAGTLFYAVQPIDERYASMEDSLSLPVLLGRYHPTRRLPENFLQLERDVEGSSTMTEVVPYARLEAKLGQDVAVAAHEQAIFVRLDLRKTLLGTLKSIIFKPEILKLRVDTANGEKREYRMVPQIAESGFVLSPDIREMSSLLAAFSGEVAPDSKVTSFAVLAPGKGLDWKDSYQVEMSTLPLRKRPQVRSLRYDAEIARADLWRLVTPAGKCTATLDVVNGLAATGTSVRASANAISLDGWGAVSLDEGIAADALLVVLRDGNGVTYRLATTISARNDVKKFLGKPAMGDIGYHAQGEHLPPGRYDMELYRSYRGNFARCDFPRPRLMLEKDK